MTRWLLRLVALMGASLVLSCAGPSSTPRTETATTAVTPTAPASSAPAPRSKEPASSARHTAVPPSHGNEELRVLFVGNSYTSSHDLPKLVKQIAEASQPPATIHTQMVSFPGYSLEQHWERGEALKTIQEGTWDVVVLQDHSLQSIAAPEALFQASQSFGEAIKATGARVLFFVTWARRDVPSMQDGITLAYSRAASRAEGLLAPVGPAWRYARDRLPQIALHDEDGSHPTTAGTYLAACVFYSTLFGRPPTGAEQLGFGDLSEAELTSLQNAAWTVVASRTGTEEAPPNETGR